ncbi:MAG: hypothetical protein IJ551_09265 [Prevotella sp.]|nr:hypothetical protein [Prevotella sp.]
MARESVIPQQLMTGALLHFESGVPISDVDVRREHKDRLARVDHVFWLWKKNPLLDTFALFKQLIRHGEKKYADAPSEYRAAQKDQWLFEFVRDHVAPPSRRQSEAVVRAAAEQAIRIGMETDNVMALTKGGKLLYDVAGLDKPESEQADMNKVAFMPTVVVTDIREVDDTKENVDDEETKRIIAKYGAYVDHKHKAIEDKVAQMEARSGIAIAVDTNKSANENANEE